MSPRSVASVVMEQPRGGVDEKSVSFHSAVADEPAWKPQNFSKFYGEKDPTAYKPSGGGFLQLPCSVTVIDYGIKRDGSYDCLVNGVEVKLGPAFDRTPVKCDSAEELMSVLPPGFFAPDDSWAQRVRWIDVEGKNGNITEFCMSLLKCQEQSVFNMIVDPKQRSMVFDLDIHNPGETLLLMAMKATLTAEALQARKSAGRHLYLLQDVEEEETVVYMSKMTEDRKHGILITLQEGLSDDVFDPVVNDILDRSPAMCERDVAHLVLRLIRASADSLWSVLNYIDRAVETLDPEFKGNPGNKDLFLAARLFESECANLVEKVAPFDATLGDLCVDYQHFIGSLNLSFKAIAVQNHGMLKRLQHRMLHCTSLVNFYKDNVNARIEWNQKIMGITLSVFSPLSFLCGVYGMNFAKPDGTPGMPELVMGFTTGPDGTVVRTSGPTGYELFWIVVVVVVVFVLLSHWLSGFGMSHPTCCKRGRRPEA